MGQRLVITIKSGEKQLAKAYYHWSGYTSSGIAITDCAVKHFESSMINAASSISIMRITNSNLTEDEFAHRTKVIIACNMLFATHAGLKTTKSESEDEAFKKMFPDSNYMIGINRSDGLIAITEKGMKDFQRYSEADVVIDIAEKTIDVSGLFCENDISTDDTSQIMELGQNINNISFDDFSEFATNVINAIKNKTYVFTSNGDNMSAII